MRKLVTNVKSLVLLAALAGCNSSSDVPPELVDEDALPPGWEYTTYTYDDGRFLPIEFGLKGCLRLHDSITYGKRIATTNAVPIDGPEGDNLSIFLYEYKPGDLSGDPDVEEFQEEFQYDAAFCERGYNSRTEFEPRFFGEFDELPHQATGYYLAKAESPGEPPSNENTYLTARTFVPIDDEHHVAIGIDLEDGQEPPVTMEDLVNTAYEAAQPYIAQE